MPNNIEIKQTKNELYIEQGFKEIAAYRFNPDKDVKCFELVLMIIINEIYDVPLLE